MIRLLRKTNFSDASSERTEKNARRSRFDLTDKDEDKKDALKMIMASYKDFQKGGINTQPSNPEGQKKGKILFVNVCV